MQRFVNPKYDSRFIIPRNGIRSKIVIHNSYRQ